MKIQIFNTDTKNCQRSKKKTFYRNGQHDDLKTVSRNNRWV